MYEREGILPVIIYLFIWEKYVYASIQAIKVLFSPNTSYPFFLICLVFWFPFFFIFSCIHFFLNVHFFRLIPPSFAFIVFLTGFLAIPGLFCDFISIYIQTVIWNGILLIYFSFLNCSIDDGFPMVTFYFENSLSLKVHPHEYLFPFVSII